MKEKEASEKKQGPSRGVSDWTRAWKLGLCEEPGSGAGSWGLKWKKLAVILLEAVGSGDHPAVGKQGACTVVGSVLLDAHDPGPLSVGTVLATHDPVQLLGLPTGWGDWRRKITFSVIPSAQSSSLSIFSSPSSNT